jgi:radical SAM superfamily enzyme YgiQ (UPF0313 family)
MTEKDPDLDILLINVGGTRKQIYQDLSKVFSAIDPPFWAALTAGYIRKNGYRVDILDANAENLDFDETVDRIQKACPAFAAIICYSQQANVATPIMVAVNELCHKIKTRLPKQKVVLTGWHPSALPEQTLDENDCDFLVQGEGFATLLGLIRGDVLEQIPGLWWQHDGQTFHSKRAENIEDLTEKLSDVAWDLLPMDKYRAFSWMCLRDFSQRNQFASIFTSLGCPFRCKFCAIHATYNEHRIRYWSPQWVLNQIDTLVNTYDVKHINIHDELFVFNRDHYLPIAEGLIQRGYDLNINAFARVDVIHKIESGHLNTLKKAGFHWFKLGIESGNDKIRKNVGKGMYDRGTIKQAVEKIHSHGIDLCANFMFGLPGDTFASMQDTLNLAVELLCVFPSFFCTMAIPGSELYEQAVKDKVPLPDNWGGYASQGYDFLPLPTQTLTSAQVLAFRDYAFDVFYKNPRYLNMIQEKFGDEARAHIEQMTAIRLKRKLLGD